MRVISLLRRAGIALLFSTIVVHVVYAQEDGIDVTYADEGIDFWFGFLQNEERTFGCAFGADEAPGVTVMASSRFDTEITIYPPGDSARRYTVRAGETLSWFFVGEQYECIGEGVCRKAFRLTSVDPVQVQIGAHASNSSEVTLLPPMTRWGTEYLAINQPVDWYETPISPIDSCAIEPRRGEIGIVIAEDSTLVTIVPTVQTRSGLPAGRTFTRLLMKGDIWKIQDQGLRRGIDDLSGTAIYSDKPVGVFTGHVGSGVRSGSPAKNFLFESLPPLQSAGTLYFTAPLLGDGRRDYVRIMATEEGVTEVRLSKVVDGEWQQSQESLRGRGEFLEKLIDGVTRIEASRPVQVGQFIGSDSTRRVGDPAMVILEDARSHRTGATFRPHVPLSSHYSSRDSVNFPGGDSVFFPGRDSVIFVASIFVRTASLDSMKIDNKPIFGNFEPVSIPQVPGPSADSCSGYSWLPLYFFDPTSEHYLEGAQGMTAYFSHASIFDASSTRAAAPIARADIVAPDLSVTDSCPRIASRIKVTEWETYDAGIDTIFLEDESGNMLLDISAYPRDRGIRLGRISLLDPDLSTRGVLHVIDRAGNRTLDTVELGPLPPEFFSPNPLVGMSERGSKSHTVPVMLYNRSGTSMKVDRATSTGGYLTLESDLPVIIWPYDSVQISVNGDLSDSSIVDTLFLELGCDRALLPVSIETLGPATSATNHNYDTVDIGSFRCAFVTISNFTDDTLTFTGAEIEGPFRPGPSVSLPFLVDPGESFEVDICFDPRDTGSVSGSMTFAGSGGSVKTTLSGVGRYRTNSVDLRQTVLLPEVVVDRVSRRIRVRFGNNTDIEGISLYSVTGELMGRLRHGTEGGSEVVFNLPEGLATGVYYLVLDDRSGESGRMVRVVL